MKFDINGDAVTNGFLEKEGACEKNRNFTKTAINFTGSVKNGPWEGKDGNATIVGNWTGGDSSCGKELKESDGYPQSGAFTIYQEEDQVILKRNGKSPISASFQYIFTPLGKTSSSIMPDQTPGPGKSSSNGTTTEPSPVSTRIPSAEKTKVTTPVQTKAPLSIKPTISATVTPTVHQTEKITEPGTDITVPATDLTADKSITKSIILLFDASGSMEDNSKINNAKSAAKNAIRDLSDTTEVALIVFSDCEKIEVTQQFTTDKNAISSKIDQIEPYGSTPLADAIDYANDYKKNARSAERTIVLFTDGIETCR